MKSASTRNRVIPGFVLLSAFAAVAVGAWYFLRTEETALSLRPDDATVVARGQRLYAEACASCHGAGLEGQPDWRQRRADGRLPAPPHDASGHTWHHSDAQLILMTRDGPQAIAGPDYQSDMPAFGGSLSDADIVAVLSYIKSRWPPLVRARHDEISRRAVAR